MRYVLLSILLMSVLPVVTGCSGRAEEQIQSGYKIYYVNSDENDVHVESYRAQSKNTDEMITEFLNMLEKGDESSQYKSAKPDGVSLLEHNLQEDTLSLKFDTNYERMSNTTEILMRIAYVKTLVQIPGVSFVDFYVGEQPLQDSHGNVIGAMNEEAFVDNSSGQVNEYEEADLILYFANEKGDCLKQTMRSMVYDQNIPLEKVVVEQLIKGPSEGRDVYPTIPSNTKLLSIMVKDSVCYVNFDEEFLKLENEVTEKVQVYSVVNSLAELPTVSKVQISINGITDRTFVDKINFNMTFERNFDIIEKEKGSEADE